MPETQYDCIVCGSCVVDLLCRPVRLDHAIGAGVLHEVEPILLTGGGIVSNTGITMARLGMRTAAFSYVGRDAWSPVLRQLYRDEVVDDSLLLTHPELATSTTVVAIDGAGERSFFHCVGAPRTLDAAAFLDRLEVFSRSTMMLLGYYSLLPSLESDLADVLRQIRETGCRTALDAAGSGGSMHPLEQVLPHLDVYVPSLKEACHQVGCSPQDASFDPSDIVKRYRDCGAPGVLGVKLGSKGVLLSPSAGEFVQVPVVEPPGQVIDTTGAGDSFYAGLLTGLIRGLDIESAGRLGAAAGACCVTSVGGCTGGKSYEETAALAGV